MHHSRDDDGACKGAEFGLNTGGSLNRELYSTITGYAGAAPFACQNVRTFGAFGGIRRYTCPTLTLPLPYPYPLLSYLTTKSLSLLHISDIADTLRFPTWDSAVRDLAELQQFAIARGLINDPATTTGSTPSSSSSHTSSSSTPTTKSASPAWRRFERFASSYKARRTSWPQYAPTTSTRAYSFTPTRAPRPDTRVNPSRSTTSKPALHGRVYAMRFATSFGPARIAKSSESS